MSTRAMPTVRYVICAQPIEQHATELRSLGVRTTDAIRHGVLTSSADMEWVGVEPLPIGQAFNLRSWDEPVERDPGWHSFERCSWVANALNLTAFRVDMEDVRSR